MNIKQKENSSLKNESESKNQFKDIDMLADEILSILDLQVSVPDDLVNKVIQKKNRMDVKPAYNFDFSKYLQIAVVFIAAIMIGVLMGKNANTILKQKRQNSEKSALIQLRDQHHLSDYNTFGKL